MNEQDDNMNMREQSMSEREDRITLREDRLRLLIMGTLSETIKREMAEMVPKSLCMQTHETLQRLRDERGVDIKEVKENIKTIDDRFNTLYIFVIGTLISAVGGLVMSIINFYARNLK